ncbi:MAG: hypothetical protein AAFQ98_16435 [Bacteroidota bacterium]
MEGIQLHNNEYARIVYDESLSMIKFKWKDKLTSHQKFKESLELYASLIEQKCPTTLFVDAVYQRITLTQELQDWHDKEILPRYHHAGVKKMGFLIPQHIFSEVTHKKTFETEQAKELISTRFFQDEKETMEWLQAD